MMLSLLAGVMRLCVLLLVRMKEGANVLVLERAPMEKRGGNSYFTDGAIRVAYNRLDMLREVLPDLTDYDSEQIVMPPYTEDDFMNDLMRVTSGKSDIKLARHLISKSFETIKWMYKNGVKFELNYDNQSYEKKENGIFGVVLPLKTSGKVLASSNNFISVLIN